MSVGAGEREKGKAEYGRDASTSRKLPYNPWSI